MKPRRPWDTPPTTTDQANWRDTPPSLPIRDAVFVPRRDPAHAIHVALAVSVGANGALVGMLAYLIWSLS